MNRATVDHISNKAENKRSLPQNWRWVRLGEVCHVVSGTTPKTTIQDYWNGDIVWITPTDLGRLNDKEILTSERLITKTGYDSCGVEIIPPDSVVMSSRAPIGHLGIAKVPLCTNQGCKSFVCGEKIDYNFLYYNLKKAVPKLQGIGSGATFSEISKTQLESFEIPLPPLPEQKRIAAILNEQLAEVEKARAAAEGQLEAAKTLPAAYLRSVFNSPEAQKWPRKKLEDICRDISDGSHFTPNYVEHGVPFLSVKDIRENSISFENCRYITEEQHQELCRRCKPEKGDVLYTKVGTTGIAKAIDINREFSIFVSVALLKLKSEVFPYYLEKVLNSPLCKIQAENLTQGMANRNLVLQDLKRIELPLPPLVEQNKIAAKLNEQMTPVEILNQSLTEQLDNINKLSGALLKRAFEGGL